jgi:hypothetical protein
MTDIMIDMTSRPRKRYVINRCHYCDHDNFPDAKPIDPTIDHNAKKTEKGDWMCGVCVSERMLSLFGGGGERKK